MRQISCLKNQKNEENSDQGGANLQPKNIRKILFSLWWNFGDFTDHPSIKTKIGEAVCCHHDCYEKGKNSEKGRAQLAGNNQGQQEKEKRIGSSSSKNIEWVFYHGRTGRLARESLEKTGMIENCLKSSLATTSSQYYTFTGKSMRGLITLDSCSK